MMEKTNFADTESDQESAMNSKTFLAATNVDPFAFGEVQFENQNNNCRLQARVERVFTNGSHSLKVNGKVIGIIDVSPDGVGKLSLESRKGDSVTNIRTDDIIEVFNSADMLILKRYCCGLTGDVAPIPN